MKFNYVVTFRLIYPQLRSEWVPALGTCAVLNSERSKLNIISTLVTDIVLLLIMLAGLFNLRLQYGSMPGVASLLWKQVGGGTFLWT